MAADFRRGQVGQGRSERTSRSFAANASGSSVWPYSPPRKPPLATGEDHRLRSETFGDDRPRAVGQSAARGCSDRHHDPRGRCAERIEIRLVVHSRVPVLPEQGVVPRPVVFGRQPEHRGIRRSLIREIRRDRSFVARERDELRHRRADATPQVRVVDVCGSGQHRLTVGQNLDRRWLVGHEQADLLRVTGDELEGIDGPAARREEIHGPSASRRDQPVQVVGVFLGRGLSGLIGLSTALDASRVVGHDCAVSEMTGQGAKSSGTHRRADEHQDRFVAGLVAPDVVCQDRARHVESPTRRFDRCFGHWSAPRGCCLVNRLTRRVGLIGDQRSDTARRRPSPTHRSRGFRPW